MLFAAETRLHIRIIVLTGAYSESLLRMLGLHSWLGCLRGQANWPRIVRLASLRGIAEDRGELR